jgi:hypothetical protein
LASSFLFVMLWTDANLSEVSVLAWMWDQAAIFCTRNWCSFLESM